MKKSELKASIREEIIEILSEETAEDIQDKAKAQAELNKELEKTKDLMKEGTWSVGSSKDIKKVMDILDMAMNAKSSNHLTSILDNYDKLMYNVVGDDLFHDDIDGAKREAKEGSMDRAQNRLSDAYERARFFLERQIDREGLKEEVDEDDMDKQASKAAKKGDSVSKIATKLQQTTKEMKQVVKKWKEAEGSEKEKLTNRLKELTKIKKELEGLL